jgi:hypothetical protein
MQQVGDRPAGLTAAVLSVGAERIAAKDDLEIFSEAQAAERKLQILNSSILQSSKAPASEKYTTQPPSGDVR